MATPQITPPLPPDIVQQQQSPEAAQSAFATQGIAPQQNAWMEAARQLQAKLQELDKWAGDVKGLLDQFNPTLKAFLQPIAQAGLDLQKAVQQMTQRSGMAMGSPVMPTPPPPNPATGPPSPVGQ